MSNLQDYPCFGVAGNFTGHLEQAGEAVDFKNVITKEVNAPKAVFPTYIPLLKEPEFLAEYPFDSEKIIFPEGEQKVQIEPECGIIFKVEWKENQVEKITAEKFGASNDCSIRKEGAKKISVKKNWGKFSKGFSANLIDIDCFEEKGLINDYRIASFLIRDGKIYDYGEDSAIRDYSYIYKKLTDWIIEKLNEQKDEGPAENINSYLNSVPHTEKIFISIGATRYTEFGETNFLKTGDSTCIILYNEKDYNHEQIKKLVQDKNFSDKKISALYQNIVL